MASRTSGPRQQEKSPRRLGRKNHGEVFVPGLGTFDSWLHQRAGIDLGKEDAAPKKNTGRARTMELARSRKKFRVARRRHGRIQEKKLDGRASKWGRAGKKNSRAAARQKPVNSGQFRSRPVSPTRPLAKIRSIPVNSGHDRFPRRGQALPVRTKADISGHVPDRRGRRFRQSGQKRTFPDTAR